MHGHRGGSLAGRGGNTRTLEPGLLCLAVLGRLIPLVTLYRYIIHMSEPVHAQKSQACAQELGHAYLRRSMLLAVRCPLELWRASTHAPHRPVGVSFYSGPAHVG